MDTKHSSYLTGSCTETMDQSLVSRDEDMDEDMNQDQALSRGMAIMSPLMSSVAQLPAQLVAEDTYLKSSQPQHLGLPPPTSLCSHHVPDYSQDPLSPCYHEQLPPPPTHSHFAGSSDHTKKDSRLSCGYRTSTES